MAACPTPSNQSRSQGTGFWALALASKEPLFPMSREQQREMRGGKDGLKAYRTSGNKMLLSLFLSLLFSLSPPTIILLSRLLVRLLLGLVLFCCCCEKKVVALTTALLLLLLLLLLRKGECKES